MSKSLRGLPTLFVTVALGLSVTAAPVRATGADPPDHVATTEPILCEALNGLILYVDRHETTFVTKAQETIARETLREAATIFQRDDLGDAGAQSLIEDVEAFRLRDFRDKLHETTESLRIVYRDACLTTRNASRAPRAVRDVLARPGFEFAAVRRNVEDLGQYAPIEFRTPVFRCVGDFEMCKASLGDELGCGITFMICVGQQLIPFASK